MQYSDLHPGRDYVWSPKPESAEDEFRRIKYLGTYRHGRVRVRWQDGQWVGLDEWVSTRTVRCPWGERRAYLRDRERTDALELEARREIDRVLDDALEVVFEAAGESTYDKGRWVGAPEVIERLWRRAGLEGEPIGQPGAFVDRFGRLHMSSRSALAFAQAFAGAEPDVVLNVVQDYEDELRAEGFTSDRRFAHEWLRTHRPAYALARQWAGAAEVERLRAEVIRVRHIAESAIYELRSGGNSRAAARFTRELNLK